MIHVRSLAALVMILAFAASAYSAGLSISSVAGPRDAPAAGTVRIDTSDSGGRNSLRFRLAQSFPDLTRASWRTVTSSVMNVTWVFPGFGIAIDNIVVAEIEYATVECDGQRSREHDAA